MADFDQNGHIVIKEPMPVTAVTISVGGTNEITVTESELRFEGPMKDNPTEMGKLFIEYVEREWGATLRRERVHD